MKKFKVAIIIVSYNTKKLLSECLLSIYEHIKNVTFEIIVVDNASRDGSRQFILERFPRVKWVQSEENLGFGRANNIGVSHSESEYLFFLNSDTIILNNALESFVQYMDKHKEDKIGVVGCSLKDNALNPNTSYGDFPTPNSELKYLWRKLLRKNVYPIKCSEHNVDFVVGADMFMRADVFEEIGGFDPNIFMYYEETDLQKRLSIMGYVNQIISSPKIIHLEGGSFEHAGLTLNRFCMSQKSFNYYVAKHFNGFSYVAFRLTMILSRLSLFFTTNWSWKSKCKAYWLCLNNSMK